MLGKAQARSTRSDATAARIRELAELLAGSQGAIGPVSGDDFAGVVDMLARQVDETVLPRTIDLDLDGATIAVLTVSNRRLVGFVSDGTEVLAPGQNPREVAAAVTSVLRAKAGNGVVSLRISGRADEFSAAGSSCSAADIRAASSQQSDGKALVAYFQTIRGLAEAYAFLDDRAVAREAAGEGSAAALLKALQAEIAAEDQSAALKRAFVKPSCTILPMPGGYRALLGVDKKATLLAIIAEDCVAEAVSAWRTHFPV